MASIIEIPVKIGENQHVLKFRRMTLGELSEWSSKVKARALLREALQKELQAQDAIPAVDRDMTKYLSVVDSAARLDRDLTDLARNIVDFVDEAQKKIAAELMDKDIGGMIAVFSIFLEKSMPSEGDSKKS
jgi:hypothetical protein